jgi:hypothetical protein
MNRSLNRPRSIPPFVAGLAYLGLAVFLLWMGFQPPDAVAPQDLRALRARSALDLQRAEAMMKLAEENGRLSKLLLSATTEGNAHSLGQIQQSLKTNGEALGKLAADSQRQADEVNRLAEERAKNQASKINWQRWFTGIAVFLLMFLAYQTCKVGDAQFNRAQR